MPAAERARLTWRALLVSVGRDAVKGLHSLRVQGRSLGTLGFFACAAQLDELIVALLGDVHIMFLSEFAQSIRN